MALRPRGKGEREKRKRTPEEHPLLPNETWPYGSLPVLRILVAWPACTLKLLTPWPEKEGKQHMPVYMPAIQATSHESEGDRRMPMTGTPSHMLSQGFSQRSREGAGSMRFSGRIFGRCGCAQVKLHRFILLPFQGYKQTNRQTDRHANKQATKPASQPASRTGCKEALQPEPSQWPLESWPWFCLGCQMAVVSQK